MAEMVEKKNNKVKKILKIVGDVLFGIFFVFMIFISVVNIRAKSLGGIPNVFGTGYVTVLTDSMTGDNPDSFNAGDLIFIKLVDSNTDTRNLKEGTVITFFNRTDPNHPIVTHRISKVEKGELITAYTTKGDKYAENDINNISDSDIIGIYQDKWSGAGTVFAWFGSGVGFFIIVVLPCILFLIFEIINFVKVYIEYRNSKNPALATGEGDVSAKIKMRKEAFDDLVKEGTLTQEQADAAMQEYVKGLMTPKEETPVAIEEKVEETIEAIIETPTTEEPVVKEEKTTKKSTAPKAKKSTTTKKTTTKKTAKKDAE